MERDTDLIIRNAMAIQKNTFRGFTDGHDPSHAMRVYKNAMKIAAEVKCNKFMVAILALLHHIDDEELFDGVEGYPNLRRFLVDNGFTEEEIQKLIDDIETYDEEGDEGKSIESMVVHDADHLDAIGATGIARNFAFGATNGKGILDSSDRFYKKLLTFKDGMLTETGKQMAMKKHIRMLKFLRAFMEEIQ